MLLLGCGSNCVCVCVCVFVCLFVCCLFLVVHSGAWGVCVCFQLLKPAQPAPIAASDPKTPSAPCFVSTPAFMAGPAQLHHLLFKADFELDQCICRLFVPSFWAVALRQPLRIEGRPSGLLLMCRSRPAALNAQQSNSF